MRIGNPSRARRHWMSQGVNLLTQDRLEFHDLDNGWMVEISGGDDFDRRPIFGVSIADANGRYLHAEPDGPSRLFRTLDEARSYVHQLDRDPDSWTTYTDEEE